MMPNDDWYKEPPGSNSGPDDIKEQLPDEGQGWEDDPILDQDFDENAWGTAGTPPSFDGAAGGQPVGPPPATAPGHGVPPTQPMANPQQGQAPYGAGGGGPMMRQPQQGMQASNDTDDMIPVILSFFLPGAGHLMLGQTQKGIILLCGVLLCGISYIINILVVLDAYMITQARKHRHVDEMEFFPK